MPLGDVGALHAWGERDDPGYRLWMKIEWISTELDSRPWAAPSTPMFPVEGQPTEIRIVVVPGTSVTVIDEHHHETGQVDLLYVGR